MSRILIDITWQSWMVLGQMGPYLLFGFGVAGLLSVLVSPEWTQRHLGGRGLRPVVEAALWGVPLPLCSCSVIPVAASMRRHGASRAATTAFLLSTPQTGVDSIAVTYALLGPVFALFRPIAALVSGVVGGVLVLLFGENASNGADVPKCEEPCCTGARSEGAAARALRFGFITLPRDLTVSLLVGVVIAGAVSALAPPQQFHAYLGGGIVSVLIAMAVGIPVYVCATASVPIAVGLMHLGASPGAALAFLIAGPATNAATLTTVWRFLGRRSALVYLFSVALSAVVSGLLLDALVPQLLAWIPEAATLGCHTEHASAWNNLWAVALLAVLGFAYLPALRSRPRPAESPKEESGASCCCHHKTS